MNFHPSWPGLTRPSTSYDVAKRKKDVDARDKPGHDEREAQAFGARFTASSKLAFADPGRSGFGWLSWGDQPDSQITS